MRKTVPIPDSFTLIRKGKASLFLKNEYKDMLLQRGIADVETFLFKNEQDSKHVEGRAVHPCVPIKEGEWMIVRRYSHGGILRPLTGSLYLFGSRSFRELTLTEEIRSCGIRTIQPLGAIHRRVFPFFYRAYLLSLEVPSAKDLLDYLRQAGHSDLSMKRKIIRSAGVLLRRFHQSGFFHADLQLKNILVAGEDVLLIDFDRSYRKQMLSRRQRIRNLLRLNRSAEKWKRKGLAITRADRWRFLSAYGAGDLEFLEGMRKALRRHAFNSFIHRLGWKMNKRCPGLGARKPRVKGSRGQGSRVVGRVLAI